MVGIAVWLRLGRNRIVEEIGVGVTGLDAKPFRAHAVEDRLRGNKLTPKLIEEARLTLQTASNRWRDLHASAQFPRSPGASLHLPGHSGSCKEIIWR